MRQCTLPLLGKLNPTQLQNVAAEDIIEDMLLLIGVWYVSTAMHNYQIETNL